MMRRFFRLLLVLLGVFVLATGCTSTPNEPVTTTSTTLLSITTTQVAVPESTLTTQTTVPVRPASLEWSRTDDEPDSSIYAITQSGSELIAAGWSTEQDLVGRVAASGDGATWTVLDTPFEEGMPLYDVTDADWGLVVVGVSGSFSGNSKAAGIWIQGTDEWVRVPVDDLASSEYASEASAVVSDGPLVVVGGYSWETSVWAPTVWQSIDGADWTRTVLSDETGWVSDVAEYGDGWVAGGTLRFGGDRYGAVWVSPDRAEWTLVTEPTDVFLDNYQSIMGRGPGVHSIAVSDDVIVAAGETGVWTSTDGTTWLRHSSIDDRIYSFEGLAIHDGVFYLAGYVAVEIDENEEVPPVMGVVWASRDGEEWHQVSDDAVFWGSGPEGWAITTAKLTTEHQLFVVGPSLQGSAMFTASLP